MAWKIENREPTEREKRIGRALLKMAREVLAAHKPTQPIQLPDLSGEASRRAAESEKRLT